MTLVVNEVRDPEVSVVMVTHGAWELTERALSALIGTAAGRFELIVIDNDSQDQTPSRLEELHGAKVILNEANIGFGPAANQGAELARASFLVLLNSDAFVHAGWLEPLLEVMRQESVGAVVPRLLNPDGSMQDAGPALAQDGSVAVYGDRENPNRLQFRFRRVLDYGSAACMLIRKSAFDAIGGFDAAFAPAYYEDADLCLRLAEGRSCIVYEPRSTVTHVRYGSGSNENAVMLSDRNRPVFLDRWRSQLRGRPWTFRSATQRAVLASRDALATPRILVHAHASGEAAGAVADAFLTTWPRARVTWVLDRSALDHVDEDRWLNRGIELLDPGDDVAWPDNRMFHYDVVVVDDEFDARAHKALVNSQPQATFMHVADLRVHDGAMDSETISRLAASGIAPPDRQVSSYTHEICNFQRTPL